MSTTGQIRLVVRGDDFGMCHAVNAGIRQAFTAGIVTTVSTMAPCPWFTEAAEIARELGIPLGAHQTLTCEWDYFRWRPITDGPSLTRPDATFWPTIELTREHAEHGDVVRELLAQVERFRSAGLALDYLDSHMQCILPAENAEVSERTGVPFLYSDQMRRRGLDTITELSPREAAGKKEWLVSFLRTLVPGTHMLVCHPGEQGPELESLTGPDSEPWPWAAQYRYSDLKVVTDPEIKALISELGIRLCSLSQALDATA